MANEVGGDSIALLQTTLELEVTARRLPGCSMNCTRGAAPHAAFSLLSAILSATQDGSQSQALFTWLVTLPVGTCAFLAILCVYCMGIRALETQTPRGLLARHHKAEYRLPLLVARLLTATTTITEGYDLVIMSGALAPCVEDLHLNAHQSAWAMGVQGFSMAFGAPIGGWLADRVGRLSALTVGYCMMLVGPLLMVASGSFTLFMLGRVVQALGMGAALSVSTAYMTEVAPAAIRGQLPSLEEVFLCVGMILAFSANYALADLPGGWRLMLGLGATLPALALPVLLRGLPPESPRYLMLRGRREEAEAVLGTLVDATEAEETLKKWCDEHRTAEAATWARTLWPEDPLVRKAFLVGVGVMCFQILCGSNLLSSYTATVLSEEEGARASNLSMLFMACSRTAHAVPAVFMSDVVGRRPMLLAGMTGTFLATGLLAALYLAEASVFPWKFAAFILFFMAFSPGLGCVSYVYMGEVMDNSVRSKGVSVAIFASRMCASLMILAFPAARDHLGEGSTFGILAGINFLGWLFILLCAPETKGVRLESISRCFEDSPKDT